MGEQQGQAKQWLHLPEKYRAIDLSIDETASPRGASIPLITHHNKKARATKDH